MLDLIASSKWIWIILWLTCFTIIWITFSEWVVTFYDVNCQYTKHLYQQLKDNSFISLSPNIQLVAAIGAWHIHGHWQECLAWYGSNFIPGAGHVDGEIMKTLWASLNVISPSAQECLLHTDMSCLIITWMTPISWKWFTWVSLSDSHAPLVWPSWWSPVNTKEVCECINNTWQSQCCIPVAWQWYAWWSLRHLACCQMQCHELLVCWLDSYGYLQWLKRLFQCLVVLYYIWNGVCRRGNPA